MKKKLAIITAAITVILCICVIAVIIGNRDKDNGIIVTEPQSEEQSIVSIEESQEFVPDLDLDVEEESEEGWNSETDMAEETVNRTIIPTTESSTETEIESSTEQTPETAVTLLIESSTEPKPEETMEQTESSEEGIALPEVDF